MLAGAFEFNGEPVQVAKDGRLLNGQHRLAAIVLSGTTLPLLVVRGLEPRLQETIDTGMPRSFGDMLTLRGEASAKQLGGVTMLVWTMQRSGTPFKGSKVPWPSAQELFDCLTQNPDIRRSALVGDRVRSAGVGLEPAIAGAIHFLAWSKHPDEADAFFTSLTEGADLSVGNPVLTLRNFLIAEKSKKRRSSRNYRVAVTIKAWNAYAAGRETKIVRWATKGKNAESFPVIE